MSSSPLKKFVVTPVVISAAIFGALTLPLALLGKQPVTIQLQGEPVFYGQLRDVASPYLGLASAISLGAGMASVAVTGWRSSRHQSSLVEAQLSALAQHIKEKEAQLEALKLSESKLDTSGLKEIANENVPLGQALKTITAGQKTQPVVEAQVMIDPAVGAQVAVPSNAAVQAVAAQCVSSSTFLGYVQTKMTPVPATPVKEISPCELEQLQNQLQQIMAQMTSVQAAIEDRCSTVKSQDMPQKVQPQVFQSWSVHSSAS